MLLYELIDDTSSPGDRLPANIAGYRLIYTLEVVVRDEFAPYLLLTYPIYASGSPTAGESDEGCWTPPFLAITSTLAFPHRCGLARRGAFSKASRRNLGSQQPDPQDPVPYDIRRLGWQIGARDPSFEYLDSFIEVKRSIAIPSTSGVTSSSATASGSRTTTRACGTWPTRRRAGDMCSSRSTTGASSRG